MRKIDAFAHILPSARARRLEALMSAAAAIFAENAGRVLRIPA